MKKMYSLLTVILIVFCSTSNVYAQCEQFASAVANFANSNVGEVLCDGAEGCDAGGFEITGFEVWLNEAYLLGKLYPGAEYVFDICEGYDANNWRAELTALEYINSDPPMVVSGTVMASAKDCQLVFTVPTSYTEPVDVMVIISEEGSCGGDLVQIDNGFPYFGCGVNGGQPSCEPVIEGCDNPPMVEIFSSECDEEGMFELEFDVTFGGASSYTVIDSLNGYSQVLTSAGTVVLGPYEGGEIPIWVIDTQNADCNLFYVLGDYCPVLCNVIADGSFEEGGNAWVEFEEPNQPDANIIDNTIPMVGNFSAYLGGYQTQQITQISQQITMPLTGSATLSFYGLFFCASDNDNFKVLVDNVPLLDVFGSNDALCSALYFQRFEVDLSSFADGNAHTIQFSLFGAGGGLTAFFLDDVQLNACACIANGGTLQIPTETTLCADSADDFRAQTNGDEYIGGASAYLFLLADGDGNIAAKSATGSFDFNNVASGEYEVVGLSLKVEDVVEVQALTSMGEIENRIQFGSLCADLTETTYMLAYDADCVGIEDLKLQREFEIAAIHRLSATDWKVDFLSEKQVNLQVMLYDVNGRLLQNQAVMAVMGENGLELAFPSMGSGVYVLMLTDGRKWVSEKFVVMQ
ncbi:MAG: T9SS type A sorting domain-containing protein [Chitinophagales bacterium]